MTEPADDDARTTRYVRHLTLPEIGRDGQARLAGASAFITGLGGLGSAAAQYLAASGVGHLHLNDFDRVAASDLQRQVLYRESDIGSTKTGAALTMLSGLNPHIELTVHEGRLTQDALEEVLPAVDVVLDCSDNFGTRYTLNAACFQRRKPLVAGAAVKLSGQMLSFDFRGGKGPCYACLFDEMDETPGDCEGAGILAPVVGVIGALQAVEAIRILVGLGEPASGRLLTFIAGDMTVRETRFGRDPGCPVCGQA